MSMARATEWRSDPEDLRDILEQHRGQLTASIQWRMARLREKGSDVTGAKEPDDGDPCDLDVRLLEIAVTTLRRIDAAVERLGEGRYGRCTRCDDAIAPVRLRAMPFAVYCHECETTREREAHGQHISARKRLIWAEGQVTNE
jgi:DnaK suppressor protein